MTINPTNAPESVKDFHEAAKKALIGKSPWIIDRHQERTSNGTIDRTRITICDDKGLGAVDLHDKKNIRHVSAFNGAFGTKIDDVRFSKWSESVYRFWLWNNTHHDVIEFYYYV